MPASPSGARLAVLGSQTELDPVADIRILNVTKIYPTGGESLVALDGITLDVAERGFVSLLGPSGCGKSTLLHIVAGLLKPSSGEIIVDGAEVVRPLTSAGVVFQTDVLLEWRTSLQNVMLAADARDGRTAGALGRARHLLNAVGLAGFEEKLPHELSGGMRQRVALCRALFGDPRRLLMDEPFGALDAITRDQLGLDLQQIWLSERKTVLFVTHSIEEAVFLSDNVVVMTPRPGRIDDVLHINLPRPRTLSMRQSPEFAAYATQIRQIFLARGVLREEPPVAGHVT